MNLTRTAVIDPIYVSCHLCHSQVGEPCKDWARRGRERYCDRRVAHAERANAYITDEGYRGPEIDVEHGLAHGTLCTDHKSGAGLEGICTECGQRIKRLEDITTKKEEVT
jgi:hypothetical protein